MATLETRLKQLETTRERFVDVRELSLAELQREFAKSLGLNDVPPLEELVKLAEQVVADGA